MNKECSIINFQCSMINFDFKNMINEQLQQPREPETET